MEWLKSPAFSRIFPFAIYISFLVLQDVLPLNDYWQYALKVSIVMLLIMLFFNQYAELKPLKTLKFKPCLMAIVFGILIFFVWIVPYPSWLTLGSSEANYIALKADGSADLMLAFIRISGAAIVVPLMEELFWRSYIMRWIDNKDFLSIKPENVSAYALVISAALFALEHQLWFAGLLAGLAYGYLYMKYKNLWVSIIAHAVTNGILGLWVMTTQEWQYW